jgi:hypothetical protein
VTKGGGQNGACWGLIVSVALRRRDDGVVQL